MEMDEDVEVAKEVVVAGVLRGAAIAPNAAIQASAVAPLCSTNNNNGKVAMSRDSTLAVFIWRIRRTTSVGRISAQRGLTTSTSTKPPTGSAVRSGRRASS